MRRVLLLPCIIGSSSTDTWDILKESDGDPDMVRFYTGPKSQTPLHG